MHTKPAAIFALITIAALSVLPALQVNAQTQMAACHTMSSTVSTIAPDQLPKPEKLSGIGNLHFPISSHNAETQMWFDQAINLVYDFWDYEANRAFEQAIRTDPDCAICHWGLANSLVFRGSESQGYAHEELLKAIALRSHADKRERMYIDAAQADDKSSPHKITKPSAKSSDDSESTTILLRQIVHKYPNDTTASLMLAESVINGYDDGKPKKGTQEAIAILQGILKQHPDDSAANHLWIHAVEASPHPEQALTSAAALATLAPSSGHMTHMPGHIFFRTGDYARAQGSFDLSESVDETYMQTQHVAVDDDWNYVHNLMYSIANLLEQGRMQQAAVVSAKLTKARGELAATLYPFSPRDSMTRLNVLLPVAMRTGDWPRVVSLLAASPVPDSEPNLQKLGATLEHFAKGMIALEQKNLDEANLQSAALDAGLWHVSQQLDEEQAAEKKKKKDDPAKPENKVAPTDGYLNPILKNLAVLSLELRAAIQISAGKIPEAKALFAQANREEQELGYREPPALIRPAAEQEAELLMSAGQTAEAESAWRKALADRPNSGFPLYGLAQLAEKSGNAEQAYTQFLEAWKDADPNLPQIAHAHQWIAEHGKQNAALKPASAQNGN